MAFGHARLNRACSAISPIRDRRDRRGKVRQKSRQLRASGSADEQAHAVYSLQ